MAGEEFVELIQGAARQVMGEQSPAELLYGEVTAASPLKIFVEGRFEVGEEFLVVSCLCKPFVTDVFRHRHTCPDGSTDEQLTSVEVWRGLEAGDRVRLLRVSDGQVYYVLEREGSMP